MCDLPPGGMFQGVMSPAEMRQVVGMRGTAAGSRDAVVDVAVMCRLATPREATVFVASDKLTTQFLARSVAIRCEHRTADRVGEDSRPRRGGTGNLAGSLSIHGAAAAEVSGIIRFADDAHHRNRHLDMRRNGRQRVTVSDGAASQQKIAEDIGTKFVACTPVTSVRVIRTGRRVRTGGNLRAHRVCRADAPDVAVRTGRPVRTSRPVGSVVLDCSSHAGQAVVDAVCEDAGNDRAEFGHAVGQISEVDAAVFARTLMTFGE